MSCPPPPPLPVNQLVSVVLEDKSKLQSDENEVVNLLNCNFDSFDNQIITHVKPVAQTGPNCGLAALAMASSITPNNLCIEDIYQAAKSRGFTMNGEMFSTLNMKVLAEAVLSPWFMVELFCDGLGAHELVVINNLQLGNLVLIPYDADKNHSPCCKKGHKAHWALVCGVLMSPNGEVKVAARHGKSRHLAVWTLESLRLSNENLVELGPERAADGKQYVLPPGGVREGLAAQFILLIRKNT